MLTDFHRRLIQRAIVQIDTLINRQLDLILHHPRFQQLEASWRGLAYLVEQASEINDKKIKLKVLSLSWRELSKDLSRAVEFDQSQFFNKIYNSEFGQPGGEPFGLLIGDYYISHRSQKNSAVNDITVLQNIAKVAAAAFVPFIASAAPSLFGLDDFSEFERLYDLEKTFQQSEYYQWKALRDDEDARFVGLVLPQILLRMPYNHDLAVNYKIRFAENAALSSQNYLWGNAVYCFAAVAARAFSCTGWFTEILGSREKSGLGGTVELTRHAFPTEPRHKAIKYLTNVCMTDRKEKLLSDFGFIALAEDQYARTATFYACPSLQKPKKYDRMAATKNANLSSMLHYILCVSRFAHYIKIIARDKIGSFATVLDCQHYLQAWIHQYTTANTDLSDELKAKYPLKEAKVQVYESKGNPGKYLCTVHLCPHYQFDQIETFLELRAELVRNI